LIRIINNITLLSTGLLLGQTLAASTSVEKYQGVAKKDGKVSYIEKHTTTFGENGKVLKAETDYVAENGEMLGQISSDFTTNLTAPAHTFTDARSGEKHGIRYEDDKIVLFLQEKGEKEQTKKLSEDIAKGGIIVGCQGLHYYLRENFDSFLAKKEIPVKMLIPGKLDYYSFLMKYVGEKDGLVEINVEIDSFFLRMFAPSLTIKYDKKTKHLMSYEGLSNILDSGGDIQNVQIKYSYNTEKS
jgi:hypothetical protein